MRNENGEYALTRQAESHQQIPPEILDLYDLDMVSYLGEEEPAGLLRKWIELAAERWGVSEPLWADFLDGVLVIPLLLALHQPVRLMIKQSK